MNALSDIAYVVAHRIIVVTVGMLFGFLGYRLFRLGIYEKAGELGARWKGASLTLRQAAPGTFFALFGAIVISVDMFEPAATHTRTFDLPTAAPLSMRQNDTGTELKKTTAPGSIAGDLKKSRQHPLSEFAPILVKLRARQTLLESEVEALNDLYQDDVALRTGDDRTLDEASARLGHMSETDTRTMLDNMK